MSNPLEPNDVIGLILDEPLKGKGIYHYSNFGYHLLGKIIEEVTHQSYELFINQYFQNLGLSETGYCQDKIGEGFAEPLDHRDENFIAANKDELDHPIEGYSSGGLYSNISDLYLLFSKQIGQQGILLQEEDPIVSNAPEFRQHFRCANGLNITVAPVTDSYEKLSQEIWKSGAVGGYGSHMIFYPNHNSFIIVLSNQPEYIEVITSQLSRVLLSSDSLEENDPLSSWKGAYSIPNWKISFSIFRKMDGKYYFKQANGLEIAINDEVSTVQQLAFPWGPSKEIHYIKRLKGEIVLCDRDGKPIIPVEKLI